MPFRLAGQNPSVEGLIDRPSDRSEPQTMEYRRLRDGPATLETIGPYNPSEDRSEVIPLELAQQMLPGHYRVPQWVPQGYQNDPTLNDLLYRSGESSTQLMEPIPNYVPEEDPGIDLLVENKDTSSGSSLVSGPAWQSEFDRLLTIDPQAAYKHVQKDIAELQAAGTRAQVVADLLYPRGPSPVFAGQNPAVGALIKDMFKPFDIVKGKGGSPGQPYGGDGQEPYWPRPTPTPQPTPKAMKNGLNEKIANLVAALRLNG